MKGDCSFRKKNISLIVWGSLLFFSCQKVIVLDINNADRKVVVQGEITNQPGRCIIALNYSTAYYNDNLFPPITGAQITIYDDAGNSAILQEKYQGIYKTDSLKGTPGRKYILNILSNGSVYTAVSIMPPPILLDSILIKPVINYKKNSISGNQIICYFTDPPGIKNFYRVVIAPGTYRVLSDKLTDGKQMSVAFRTDLVSKDTIMVQLQCIDKSTYDFYNTLGGAKGSSEANQFLGALPGNPTNNISNNALGYFAAYSVTTNTLVVP